MARKSRPPAESAAVVEQAEEAAWQPPRAVALLLLALTISAFGYLVWLGVARAQTGLPRVAGKLLAVEERNQTPLAFDLAKIDGGSVSLANLRGKVVMINFWATWCPPCVEEMPSMVRFHNKFKSDPRFVMLAVSTDESWDPVKKFFGGESPGFTVLLDPKGDLAKRYGTTMFPETYLLVDGKVVGFIEGPRNWDAWYAETFLRGVLDGA
jgi:thiol-disulfide isomerase/thioredoxin